VLSEDITGSIPVRKRLAEKPPAIPANTAAIPANGARPAEMNNAAASGGSTIYPESDATDDVVPRKTSAGVTSRRGTSGPTLWSNAAINPDFSATDTPSSTTMTIPSGAKLMKLKTIRETM
jgi:hypothetical protein